MISGDLNHATRADSSESLLVTADEVAALLGISTRTLWRLCSGGRCPTPLRLGGNTRWRRSEVELWVAQGCPEGRPDERKGATN